ncbi:hypothetical protein [Paraburkholderia sp. RL17-373-BIF-A]|uniref:hypothetical protein n=1 Tax=Paraburkholderia sp. RL17-373-BIF-A TaxID=3031629 RepID=UPI0038B7B7E0
MLIIAFVLTVYAVAFLSSAVLFPSLATSLTVGSMSIRIAGWLKRSNHTPALAAKERV